MRAPPLEPQAFWTGFRPLLLRVAREVRTKAFAKEDMMSSTPEGTNHGRGEKKKQRAGNKQDGVLSQEMKPEMRRLRRFDSIIFRRRRRRRVSSNRHSLDMYWRCLHRCLHLEPTVEHLHLRYCRCPFISITLNGLHPVCTGYRQHIW